MEWWDEGDGCGFLGDFVQPLDDFEDGDTSFSEASSAFEHDPFGRLGENFFLCPVWSKEIGKVNGFLLRRCRHVLGDSSTTVASASIVVRSIFWTFPSLSL